MLFNYRNLQGRYSSTNTKGPEEMDIWWNGWDNHAGESSKLEPGPKEGPSRWIALSRNETGMEPMCLLQHVLWTEKNFLTVAFGDQDVSSIGKMVCNIVSHEFCSLYLQREIGNDRRRKVTIKKKNASTMSAFNLFRFYCSFATVGSKDASTKAEPHFPLRDL